MCCSCVCVCVCFYRRSFWLHYRLKEGRNEIYLLDSSCVFLHNHVLQTLTMKERDCNRAEMIYKEKLLLNLDFCSRSKSFRSVIFLWLLHTQSSEHFESYFFLFCLFGIVLWSQQPPSLTFVSDRHNHIRPDRTF